MNLINGDCLEEARKLPADYFHSIVTDPPYGIEWLGNDWDNPDKLWDQRQLDYPSARGSEGKHNLNAYEAGEKFYLWFKPIAREMYRTLKKGGSCFVFSSTTTLHHPMRCLEEAGFDIKDTMMWNYHTGFPKAISVPFLIDRRLGLVEKADPFGHDPISEQAKLLEGWVAGKVKPAWEPIIWAVKSCDNIVDTMIKDGIGGVNAMDTRLPADPELSDTFRYINRTPRDENNVMGKFDDSGEGDKKVMFTGLKIMHGHGYDEHAPRKIEVGRFPANVIIVDGALINNPKMNIMFKINSYDQVCDFPKPRRDERDLGIQAEDDGNPIHGDLWDKKLVCKVCGRSIRKPKTTCECGSTTLEWKQSERKVVRNVHPTVKPIAIFEHLIRLVTKPGQLVADFFEGSGTCAIACKKSGREHWGCEIKKEYFEIAKQRVDNSYNTFDPLGW